MLPSLVFFFLFVLSGGSSDLSGEVTPAEVGGWALTHLVLYSVNYAHWTCGVEAIRPFCFYTELISFRNRVHCYFKERANSTEDGMPTHTMHLLFYFICRDFSSCLLLIFLSFLFVSFLFVLRFLIFQNSFFSDD